MRLRIALVLMVAMLPVSLADAAEPYRVGMTAAVTGAQAATYAPTVDAYKVYLKRLNDAGGIHGHPVELVVEDDGGDAGRTAAAARRLSSDGAVAIVAASTSATYAPLINEARASKTPLLFGGGVCPREALPTADPLVFCSSSFGAQWDSRFAVAWIKGQVAGKKAKIGFVAMAVPVSQAEMDFAEKLAKEHGLDTVPVVTVPATTTDFTPFASRLKDAGVDWVLSWAPWPVQIGVFEALARGGWSGGYLLYAHQPAQEELTRLKAANLHAFGANAMFTENLPIHAEIRELAKGVSRHPPHYLAEGWVSAMVLEHALRRCGWPCSKDKLAGALTLVNVDTKGLRGGALEWTADNHYRRDAYYKVYRWDAARGTVAPLGDWTRVEVR